VLAAVVGVVLLLAASAWELAVVSRRQIGIVQEEVDGGVRLGEV
jgi:hypothetical protein